MSVIPLSGEFKGSFAYNTIKDRMPVILTTVIDHLCRQKSEFYEEYGESAEEDLKEIISKLSKLKSNLQTNKPLDLIKNGEDKSAPLWNSKLIEFKRKSGEEPRWFSATWLLVECYMYKVIRDLFKCSQYMMSYDPFRHQKMKCYEESSENISFLLHLFMNEMEGIEKKKFQKDILRSMVEFSLWGNQFDLCFSPGLKISSEGSSGFVCPNAKEFILADDFEFFWKFIDSLKNKSKPRSLAFILDNAGFELVADLCLAAILTKWDIFQSVTFYVKSYPWFVSDTTLQDFQWTLSSLKKKAGSIGKCGIIFSNNFEKNVWKVEERDFWTLPHDFAEMKAVDEALYSDLSQFSLLIFKGDLNYRKLVGDLNWSYDVPLKQAFRGFHPSPILSLRTLKGGPVVGLNLQSNVVKNAKTEENWLYSGKFGVVQFCSHENYIFNLRICLLLTALVPAAAFLIKRFVY